MGLFQTEEERKREARYEQAVKQIIIFPGSVVEYQVFRGYEMEAVDTGLRDKGVYIKGNSISGNELRNHLVDSGVEAIVNAHYWKVRAGEAGDIVSEGYYGLPVRRKKER